MGFGQGLLDLGFAALLGGLGGELAVQVLEGDLQALGLGRDLFAAGGVGPVGIGQGSALSLKLGLELVAVVIGQRLSTEGTLGAAGLPLQQIELVLDGFHVGPELVVAHGQAGGFLGQGLKLSLGGVASGLVTSQLSQASADGLQFALLLGDLGGAAV